MAQHDYVIANQSGSAFRADLNNALSATVTGNSGTSAPSTTYAYMIWNDTTSNQRKIRNSANNAWIVLSTLSGGNVFDDDVTFNGASYNLVWDKSDNALEFVDNAKLAIGTGNRCVLWHNATHTYIQNSTGNIVIQALSGEDSIVAAPNAGVTLYWDTGAKFATNNTGARIEGTLILGRADSGGEGGEIQFNRASDDAVQWTNDVNGTDSAATLRWFTGGSVKLNLNTDGDLSLPNDNAELRLGANSTGDLLFYHNATNSFIKNVTGDLKIQSSETHIVNSDNSEFIAKFRNTGSSFEAYYGGELKLATQSGGIFVGATSVGGHGTTIGVDGQPIIVNFSTSDVRTMQSWESDEGTDEVKVMVESTGKIYARTTSIQAFSSERRTKKNIVELDKDKAWNTIKDTPFYTFNYKTESDEAPLHHAPIVDELPEDMVLPTQDSDEVGVINTYHAERLQFRAYSALQQALKKIETLETKVAALEG